MPRGSTNKKAENEEEAKRIIEELKAQNPGDATKVMVLYKLGMDDGDYPEVRLQFLEMVTGGRRQTMYRRLENVKQGFGIDYAKKRTALNPAESEELLKKVIEAHDDFKCMGITKITQEANELRSKRECSQPLKLFRLAR